MKKKIQKSIFLVLMVVAGSVLYAQPGGGGGGQGNGGPPPSTSGPIDGGAFILVGAVSAYVAYRKKKGNTNEGEQVPNI